MLPAPPPARGFSHVFSLLVPEMFLKNVVGKEAGGLTRDGACRMSWLFSFMNEACEAVWENGGPVRQDQCSGGKVMKLMVKVR